MSKAHSVNSFHPVSHTHLHICCIIPICDYLDYYKDEAAFFERVEQDATTFRPPGKLIYTYTRPVSTISRKGKNVAPDSSSNGDHQLQVHNPEDDETVDFEVYHVSTLLFVSSIPPPSTPQCLWNFNDLS